MGDNLCMGNLWLRVPHEKAIEILKGVNSAAVKCCAAIEYAFLTS